MKKAQRTGLVVGVVLSASVSAGAQPAAGWTDRPIRPGVTSIKAAHFDELRARVATLRAREELAPVRWTDSVLIPGATTIKRVHLAELRAALAGVYDAREQRQPAYVDPTLPAGRTFVRAAHVMELREAVEILESPAPSLEGYYTQLPLDVIDPSYRPHGHLSASTDLDGDGNEDLVLLGWTWRGTLANHRPQPGRVFLGDGDGGFRRAPAELFPGDTLNTVWPSCCPQFSDLNGDGLPDMFLPLGGWDRDPFPGEQNRLYLSRPGGGWRDATSELPQLTDFTHSTAIGYPRSGNARHRRRQHRDDDRILPYVALHRAGQPPPRQGYRPTAGEGSRTTNTGRRGQSREPAINVRTSPKLAQRQHQPHQVRLPRNRLLSVDLLQVRIDGPVLATRRLGDLAHALAFRQPGRDQALRARQLQRSGYHVAIDATGTSGLDDQNQRRHVPTSVVRLRDADRLDVHHKWV